MPTYGGTLAAVRALGGRGVQVTVAGSEILAPARWSRSAHRFERAPSPREPERFLGWLLEFGRRAPGHFLYPTSDDLAWFLARHAPALRRDFLLFQPPVQTVVRLLDKKRLHAACGEVGLRTLPTWFPETTDEVARLAPSLPRPLLIKPRTQVFLRTENHGQLVEAGDDLPALHHRWLQRDRYLPGVEEDFGPLRSPMLQEFRTTEEGGVYSVSGFIDRDGTLLGARASRKVLQRPLRVGIGLCFEDAPPKPALLHGLVSLCRRVGYFGVFEAEFIRSGGEHHLIDFNPRFYGQMHFECARGLPLPVFAYLAAQGDHAGLRALSEEAARFDARGYRYAFRFGHRLLFALRRLAGTASAEESARWSRWLSEDPERLVDASADPTDRAPGRVHALAELWAATRHVRGYLRGSVLDRR